MPTLEKDAIADLIPHAGAMCLIERVTDWSPTGIACETATHRDPANPLRSQDALPIAAGIEYAAQAMAIHGGLSGASSGKPKVGYLASIREIKFRRARLDDAAGPLTIYAEQLLSEEGRVIYEFTLAAEGTILLSGRAAVMLQERE
jgi:predicted hotdog family 3-hydroxylacyl-ACP dehydratase